MRISGIETFNFFKRMLYCILLLLPSCSNSNLVAVEEPVPARFINSGDDFKSRIEFPETDLIGTIIIRCATPVSRVGETRRVYVYSEDSARNSLGPFEAAVLEAFGDGIELEPAQFNGRNASVWFNFSVVFQKDSSFESISVHPNYLYNTASYGMNYSDPQRVREPSFFPPSCQMSGTTVWVAANIDSSGSVSDVRIVRGQGSERCKRELVSGVQKSVFIPAQYENRFVDGIFAEAWISSN